MYNLTAAEAAELLGIGRARVYQLIDAGSLSAERVGGIWLIDDESVHERLESKPKAGRPALAAASNNERAYTLMNRNHEVLTFHYDADQGRFSDADSIIDASRAPVGIVSPRGTSVAAASLAFWWSHRAIPASRDGLDARLKELGLKAARDLPFASLGLSLSDQYWVRPLDRMDITWEDISFFCNPFEEMDAGAGWLSDVGLCTPANTSEGQLPKTWAIVDGCRVLVKGGSVLGQEPYNEAVATALYCRLLEPGEFVEYRVGMRAGEPVSLCDCFISPDEEYVPAYYISKIARKPNHRSHFQHYLECCARLGVEDAERMVSKMLVCDDILANTDRHWCNFGLIRNVETLECHCAPLFDSGSSLWVDVPDARLRGGDYSFSTKPFYEDANRQLRLVNDYSWFNPEKLEGFTDEAAEILSANAALAGRIDYICEGIQARIDRILRIL